MKIGIIGAMNEEVVELKEAMEISSLEKKGNLTFYIGKIENKEIVLVECGIGKVNAAICATILIDHFGVNKVLFTGVAGALNPDINIGDTVISTDLLEHDFDATAFGYEAGVIPRMGVSRFKADDELQKLAVSVAKEAFGNEKVWQGTILSGDVFVASVDRIKNLREKFNGECVEMEGASVAHVCYLFEIPFLIIRSISDKANHDAESNFNEFVKIAATNSKVIIENILKEI